MKTWSVLLVVLMLMLPAHGFTQGKGYGVELSLTSPKLIVVEPGKIVTASYLVSNRTNSEVELRESLDLPSWPKGWQPVTAYQRAIVLAAGEQKVQLITLVVPRKHPAGKYEITYSMIGRKNSELVAIETFAIVIKPTVNVDAVIEDKPEIVLAGEEYEVHMRLINNGNSTVSMKMTAKSSPEFPTSIDPTEVMLDAGRSCPVNLFVKTDPSIRSKTNHVLEVGVLADAPECGIYSLARTVFVEVLPQLGASIDLRNRVPSQARFIAVGQNDEKGAQVEYSGSGTLDESGTRKVDFLFRGPDVMNRSAYGTRDVLHFAYADPSIGLMLGDKLFSLSPLSELLAYARGAEASLHPGATEIGFYYAETRWDVPPEKKVGVYAGYRFGNAFKLKANFLDKRKDDSSSPMKSHGDIYTIQARINPGAILDLGLEYAQSYSGENNKTGSPAHRVTLDGSVKNRIWYTLENTYAAPDFRGYYRDVIYSSGTVSADVYRNLRSHVSYRLAESNLNADPNRSIASRELSYLGGLSYTFPAGTNASVEFETLDRKDRLVPAQFDFTEDLVRLGLGNTYRIVGIQTYAEGAKLRNRLLDGQEKILGNYSLYTYIRPSPTQSYTLFTRIGHNSFTGDPERTINVGASAWLRLKKHLSLNLSYQKNNIDSAKLPLQDYFFSTLELTLPNEQSISLMGRWFKFENVEKEDYAFLAAYTIPFKIPAMKKRSFGFLKGTVIDKDQASAVPMPNVVLSIGDMATMTNQRGEFSFPALAPGPHQLKVDQRSMGMNKITTDCLPIPVEIAGGRITLREIGVSSACEISGSVVLLALDPAKTANDAGDGAQQGLFIVGSNMIKQGPIVRDELVEAGGLEQVLVELSNGEERLYQRTDEKGRFSFKGLRPGTWRLRIDAQNLPPQHSLEKENFEIALAHGEKRAITASVWPRPRSIQLLPGGKIIKESKAEKRQ